MEGGVVALATQGTTLQQQQQQQQQQQHELWGWDAAAVRRIETGARSVSQAIETTAGFGSRLMQR